MKTKNLVRIASFLFSALLIATITSCSSSRSGVATTKVSKGDISNTWIVNDVYLEGFPSGYEIQSAFDMAPYQEFKGSTWSLYGGYGGNITLTNGISQNIYWSLLNDGFKPTFQFKKVDEGEKAREVTTGYELEISASSKDNLTLRSPFKLLNGNTAYIVYSLTAQ